MSARAVQGYMDYKNAIRVARWRLRFALTQGRDLQDLRPGHELVIFSGCIDNTMPEKDWSLLHRPTYARRLRERGCEVIFDEQTPAFLRRQAK